MILVRTQKSSDTKLGDGSDSKLPGSQDLQYSCSPSIAGLLAFPGEDTAEPCGLGAYFFVLISKRTSLETCHAGDYGTLKSSTLRNAGIIMLMDEMGESTRNIDCKASMWPAGAPTRGVCKRQLRNDGRDPGFSNFPTSFYCFEMVCCPLPKLFSTEHATSPKHSYRLICGFNCCIPHPNSPCNA